MTVKVEDDDGYSRGIFHDVLMKLVVSCKYLRNFITLKRYTYLINGKNGEMELAFSLSFGLFLKNIFLEKGVYEP